MLTGLVTRLSVQRIVVYIAIAAVIVLGVVYTIGRLYPTNFLQVATALDTRPVAVEVPGPIRQVTKWKTRTVEVPVVVREPTPEQAAKVEKATGIPIPTFVEAGDRELGVWPVPKAPPRR